MLLCLILKHLDFKEIIMMYLMFMWLCSFYCGFRLRGKIIKGTCKEGKEIPVCKMKISNRKKIYRTLKSFYRNVYIYSTPQMRYFKASCE